MGNKIRHIPKSDSLQIETPCMADWNTMVGDDKIRFCESCQKNVHNISRMDDREIRRRMKESEGYFCAMIEPAQAASAFIEAHLSNVTSDSTLTAASVPIALPPQTIMSAVELAEKKLARLEGKVIDDSGAVLVGAAVGLISTSHSGVKYAGTCTASGFYFEAIKVGEYVLVATFDDLIGFKRNLVLKAGKIRRQDVELTKGMEMVLGGISAETTRSKGRSRLKE